MKTIEMTPYDQKDILDVLDFALKEYEYRASFIKGGTDKYWIHRIKQLKKVVRGETMSNIGIASPVRHFK